jgi:general secretion pathway protein B
MTPFRPPVSSIPAPAQPSQGASPLRLQVHVYSDTPAQRMVFINGRRYGEGDRIEGGAVLERITPDGAVVNQNGQRFTISDRP